MSWQSNVLGQIAVTRKRGNRRESTKSPFGPAMKPLQFAATTGFMVFVNGAAEKVGVNRSTYIRRALAVHTAHVLGIPVRLILMESPEVRAFGAQTSPQRQALGLHDNGEGIEDWCPHPGCDGTHLSVPNSGQQTGLP